jgi:hypothetical protein
VLSSSSAREDEDDPLLCFLSEGVCWADLGRVGLGFAGLLVGSAEQVGSGKVFLSPFLFFFFFLVLPFHLLNSVLNLICFQSFLAGFLLC